MPSLPRTTATLISLHFKQTELRNLVSGLLMERLMTLRFAAYEERRGRGDNSLRKGLAILLRIFLNVSAIYPFHAHFLSPEKIRHSKVALCYLFERKSVRRKDEISCSTHEEMARSLQLPCSSK